MSDETEEMELVKLGDKFVQDLKYGDIINPNGSYVVDPVLSLQPGASCNIRLSDGGSMLLNCRDKLPYYGNVIRRDHELASKLPQQG